MSDAYTPPAEIIDAYANVLVNFALNSGQGVKPGEVVECLIPDVAKPLALALQNTLLKAGAHPMVRLTPTEFDKDFYTLANDDQLTFFPENYLKARLDLVDHSIGVLADVDPYELAEVDPTKIIRSRDAKKAYRDWRNAKENKGQFTWTVALWGMPAKAKMVNLSLEDYWQQIIQACFLDVKDPVAKWREVSRMQDSIRQALDELEIEWIHLEGPDVDLKIKIGKERSWEGGSGRNIPSFEIFTSPDWRGTEGWIRFNQPLYRYGQVLEGIELTFNDGLVTQATAKKGNTFLQEMLKSPNANKLGEFSLTDKRMSRITHIMAETLFDENIGGKFGNTHVALGMSYQNCYKGDPSKVSKTDWEIMGYNDSAEHTDIISTTDRTVTAMLQDGSQQVIYEKGQFLIGE